MTLLERLKTHLSMNEADPGFYLSEEDITEIMLALKQRSENMSRVVIGYLTPKRNWKVQSFEFYAAHFLIGSGLIYGDLEANIRSLAAELRNQYNIGIEHGEAGTDAIATR